MAALNHLLAHRHQPSLRRLPLPCNFRPVRWVVARLRPGVCALAQGPLT
jgi:hypothetical protein